jgi:Domain of unknown function (DUF2019)
MTASDLAARSTDDLVREFKDTAKRVGTVFTGKSTPEKFNRTPERRALVERMRALSAELCVRRPMADIRALLDDEDADVRGWAAGQFLSLDPEWASATFSGLVHELPAREVLDLRRRALNPPPKGPPLAEWSTAALAERFEDAAMREYAERFVPKDDPTDVSLHNCIVDEIIDVRNELIRRNEVASVLPLLDSPNIAVRTEAARATLPVAPERASAVLEAVVASKDQFLLCAGAAETLQRWRERSGAGREGA